MVRVERIYGLSQGIEGMLLVGLLACPLALYIFIARGPGITTVAFVPRLDRLTYAVETLF